MAQTLIRQEEYLPLIPAVVVLMPGLKAVGRAVHPDEIAVPLRDVENTRVTERALQVVPVAVLLEDTGSQRVPGIHSQTTACICVRVSVHLLGIAQIVARPHAHPTARLCRSVPARSVCTAARRDATTPRSRN